MKALTAFLLFSLCILPGFVQSQTFSRQAVLEDFETLQQSLNDAHYQVDVYTPQSTLDSLYRVIRSEIQADSFTFLETTNLFQRYIGAIQNGHTEIDFPVSSYMEYAMGGGTIFPLEIAIEDGKALIRKNWSGQESILPGMQLLSIDGVEINQVLAEIYPQIPGERLYFKQAKLEFFSFPRYAWQVFGEQETFRVKILAQGTIKPYTLKAVPVIEGFELKRDEILNAQQRIEFLPEAAYLNPGDLSGDEPTFQAFIDSAFTEIKKQQAKNLIIDLRNNRGGNNSFSDYLVAYIADQPFRWNDRFTLKTSAFLKTFVRENYDTTDVYW
ncbi:MAG: S41 family peptidase, partial [Bacteroidota bacterium]